MRSTGFLLDASLIPVVDRSLSRSGRALVFEEIRRLFDETHDGPVTWGVCGIDGEGGCARRASGWRQCSSSIGSATATRERADAEQYPGRNGRERGLHQPPRR